MKLIVITDTALFSGEHEQLHQMFRDGLETLHVRKPRVSTAQLRTFLEGFDERYRKRIVIHMHHELAATLKLKGIHLTEKHKKKSYISSWFQRKVISIKHPEIEESTSYHSISHLNRYDSNFDYVFLSPIFESISKVGYRGTFNENALKQTLERTQFKVIAMGGVDETKIEKARDLGFKGVAVLGALWQKPDPNEHFRIIKETCEKYPVEW